MPVETTERNFYPDDPEYFIARLARDRAAALAEPASPWAEPYYAGIPADGDLPLDETERTLVWPGPAMIMPADLLPDGKPPSSSDFDNAERIRGLGRRPRDDAEADAVWRAYERQQNALRARAGLPQPVRGPHGPEDTPETVGAIKKLHAEERAWRLRRGRHRAG
ncbi:hypothetical protein [Amycolatopsis sp. NPDC051903]|uniref:hypothetical protein n=1 Tax=Amycolatopsis sp. NPDC051903 TaxID=3363936 RepID=UPI0037B726E4